MPCKHRVLHGHLEYVNSGVGFADWKPSDLPDFICAECERAGISFVDPTTALRAESERGRLTYNHLCDSHLSASGSRLVAEVVANAVSGL